MATDKSSKRAADASVTVEDAPDEAVSPEAAPAGREIKSLSHYDSVREAIAGHVTKPSAGQVDGMLAALEACAQIDGVVPARNPISFLDSLIRRVDEVASEQLKRIMHAPEFLKLEGTWRGVQRLVKETDTNKTLWVELLDATKDELRQDFADAVSYNTSYLWKQAYEDRYDTNGGKPVGAFVSGFEFSNNQADLALLKNFAQLGAATEAPFILSAAPELLGLRSFSELKHVNDVKNTFEGTEYTEWNELRRNPDSRFLAMTMPRVLARLPYGSNTIPANGLNFEEAPLNNRGKLDKMPHNELCWSSSAYAMGGVLTKAFRQTNWCTAIIGNERERLNGGTVADLPLYTFHNSSGNPEVYPPTETTIPGNKEFALAEMGLLPLSYELGSDKAQFMGGKTMFLPQGKPGTAEYKNQFVASLLPNILPAGRIAHYMKVMGRKFHGRFATAEQLQKSVMNWLGQFKTDANADEKGKAQFPIQDFKVDVKEGWTTGVYDVRLTLKFWTMIYQINTDVVMAAEVDTQDGR
jgi:type VI secretion system protein ImpC